MPRILELSSTATSLATAAWREGRELVDFGDHVETVARADNLPEIAFDEIRSLIGRAMDKFDGDRTRSDSWLGPRLHAALRLTRREAAHRGLWRHLAMVQLPHYVRWRFGAISDGTESDKIAPAERFHGDSAKHGLARLWWGAEQFRNGADYAPVEKAFLNQDLMNNLLKMDISHHRPTCQAAVRVLFPDKGEPLTGDHANSLSKAANAAATTLLIDALAPDGPLDPAERESWICETVDALKLAEDELPSGPPDPKVPEKSVLTMAELFATLVAEAPLRPSRRRRTVSPPEGF
jgi:Family of unknown function (DUF6339)